MILFVFHTSLNQMINLIYKQHYLINFSDQDMLNLTITMNNNVKAFIPYL
jgi:hypothetical protein